MRCTNFPTTSKEGCYHRHSIFLVKIKWEVGLHGYHRESQKYQKKDFPGFSSEELFCWNLVIPSEFLRNNDKIIEKRVK